MSFKTYKVLMSTAGSGGELGLLLEMSDEGSHPSWLFEGQPPGEVYTVQLSKTGFEDIWKTLHRSGIFATPSVDDRRRATTLLKRYAMAFNKVDDFIP